MLCLHPSVKTQYFLEMVGLENNADDYSRTLSGGMRRRLLVAKAMVHSPPILILDEPTAGVDIELRHKLWNNIRQLNQRGVTIILTTHYLEEAEKLCTDIAIINHGRIVKCAPTKELIAEMDRKEIVLTLHTPIDVVPPELLEFGARITDSGRLAIRYRPSEHEAGKILAAVMSSGIKTRDIETREPHLDDIFLSITRKR